MDQLFDVPFSMYVMSVCFRQPMEGLLHKYTNVMKGWQFRWFVLDPQKGKLHYFEVSF